MKKTKQKEAGTYFEQVVDAPGQDDNVVDVEQ